jgi:regulator of sigma E protease
MIFAGLLMALGFGLVIFIHELGHFLAAKWAGVRVDAFAVGFGRALIAFRKGMGVRFGSTRPTYMAKARAHLASKGVTLPEDDTRDDVQRRLFAAADELGLGQTEYRFNWIPFGGYVRMLGQDDSDPTSVSDDPQAYNRKSVGKRMVIVSAGVVMNVILAAVLFVALFLHGFTAPTSEIGYIAPASAASESGMKTGDIVRSINDHPIHDFSKIAFNVALLPRSTPVPVEVERAGERVTLNITARPGEANGGMLMFGIGPAARLQGLDPEKVSVELLERIREDSRMASLLPGETVISVNGTPVTPDDYALFDRILQQSRGVDVELVVLDADNQERIARFAPRFATPFDGTPLNFAGIEPRTSMTWVGPDEPGLKPGDLVESIRLPGNQVPVRHPSVSRFDEIVAAAPGPIALTVRRGDEIIGIDDLSVASRFERSIDPTPVVADVVEGSPADRAGVAPGDRIQAIAGRPVESWHDIHEFFRTSAFTPSVPITISTSAGMRELTLDFSESTWRAASDNRYVSPLLLAEKSFTRRTSNPLTAVAWGIGETRDLIVKTYLTIRRIAVDQTVSPRHLMGPIGMFQSGTFAAYRGFDWLLWFLAMVSANLAVVNFLPIPIVDGGQFCFLLMEKITGKPPSPRLLNAAHLFGLMLILSLFLFVTYNDLVRLFTT